MKKRREAFLVKDVDPMFSVIMNIMPHRYDATNTTMLDLACEPMDTFIDKMRADGLGKFTYMDLIIAAAVRCYAMRPQLNRFTMNARMYERYGITVCFTIKSQLKDDAGELQVKYTFCGNETVVQVRDILERTIRDTKADAGGATSDTAASISSLPMFLSKALVKFLRFSDKRNFLPKSFMDVSPFHASFFITNLKSIRTESINHHCYDFGTTSMFLAMGKEKMIPIVDENDQIVPGKIMKLGVSCDERICDGLYFGKSFHLLRSLLRNPEELLTEYHDEKVDAEIERQRVQRLEEQALAEKKAKKNKNKQSPTE
ncbi:MAG: 2-oxo acid dehydrogenase subunit E2 [Clostridia bacterium]|nr:2-oxo acid dehydrogenase subunit E2 [Clostridia bacterium]